MVLSPDTIPFFHTDVVCAVSQGATQHKVSGTLRCAVSQGAIGIG